MMMRQAGDGALRPATANDLATIQKLVDEFEAELAALDVRVAVVQRRLREVAQELRPAQVTGDFRFRYEISRVALNNPGTGPIAPASTQPALPTASTRVRLAFNGGVNDDLRLRIRVTTFGQNGTTVGLFGGVPPTGHLNSMFAPLSSAAGTRLEIFSQAELSWIRAFGNPFLEIHLGRLGGDTWLPREGDPPSPTAPPPGRTTALQLGPIGLLFNTAKDIVGESSLRTYAVDALAVTYMTPPFGAVAIAGGTGSATFYAGRIQAAVGSDLVVGGNVLIEPCYNDGGVDNSVLVSALRTLGVGAGVSPCSFVWWGAQNGWIPSLNTGTTNPYTNIPGTGYSIDADARLGPSLRLQAELALWNDSTTQATDLGWQIQMVLDDLLVPGSQVIVGYQSFGTGFYPPHGGAEDPVVGFVYPGGFRNGFIIVKLPAIDGWVVSGGYEAGTSLGVGPQPGVVGFGGPSFSAAVCQRCSPAGQPFSGWLASVEHTIAPQTILHVYYYGWEFNGASQADVFRLEVGHLF